MEPTTFEKEWEEVRKILGQKSTQGTHELTEDSIKFMCKGMYTAGKAEVFEYLITQSNQNEHRNKL